MKPTDEQIKEFWEWCGLTRDAMNRLYGFGQYPDVDLNNLFKYAVPRLQELLPDKMMARFFVDWLKPVLYDGKDPALALFWAIYEVIK